MSDYPAKDVSESERERPVKLSESGAYVNAAGMNEEVPTNPCIVPGVSWISDPALREMQFPELQWLIADELPVGYTLIMGAPKTGKTALVLPLAHRLVRAGRRVLYIKLDDSLRRMRNRTVMANPRNDPLSDLWYVDGWRPRSAIEAFGQLALWLGDAMAKGMHFDAVIVDTYGRFIGRRPAGDVFGHDYQMGEEFKRLCETFDASVIVTHHTRKGAGNEEDWLDMMSGSAGMAAAADCIWYITRTRGGRDGILRITGNDMEELEKPVILGKDMVWRANNTLSVAQARHSGVPRAVLDFLAGEAEASASRITAGVGAPANTVHVALQRLAAEGVVEWTRVGRDSVWSLTLHQDNQVCSAGESEDGGSSASVPVQAPEAGASPRERPAPAGAPPASPVPDPAGGEPVPVQAGSGRATSKLIEVLTASRLHPLFKLDPAVKAEMPFDRVCLGGKGNQWNLWPASDPGGMVFRFDRKAAYYASHPWIAPNVLTRCGPKTWEQIKDERLAGMFEIVTTPWVHKNMPSPYGRAKPRTRELVPRPILNRLHRLSEMGLMDFPKITFGMVGRGSENLLNDWLDWCLSQRRAAAGDQELADAIKADQNQAMGSLRTVGTRPDGTPKPPGVVDRWDWQYGMIGHHYAMLHHYAIKSQMAGEPLGAVGNTDELVYFMPEGTDPGWVPATLVPLIERSQFALKSVEPSGPWFEKYRRGLR